MPNLTAVEERLSLMLAILYSKGCSRLLLLNSSCSQALQSWTVKLLMTKVWIVPQHELVNKKSQGRGGDWIIRVLSESSCVEPGRAVFWSGTQVYLCILLLYLRCGTAFIHIPLALVELVPTED